MLMHSRLHKETGVVKVGDGVKFQRIRRITGYLVGTTDRFNNAKRAEEHDRVKHGMGSGSTNAVYHDAEFTRAVMKECRRYHVDIIPSIAGPGGFGLRGMPADILTVSIAVHGMPRASDIVRSVSCPTEAVFHYAGHYLDADTLAAEGK